MRTTSTTPSSVNRFLARESWIGPLSGFVCSVAVSFIGRALDFEYRSETAMVTFFLVAVLVTTYYNGRLKRHPFAVAGFAIISATVGAVIAHSGK